MPSDNIAPLMRDNPQMFPRPPKPLPLPPEMANAMPRGQFDIALHQLRKAMHRYLLRGPSNERHNLKTDIRRTTNEMLELYIAFTKSRNKSRLYELDIKHEFLRHLWLEYYELGCLSYSTRRGNRFDVEHGLRRYAFINNQLNIMGRMIGAKINQVNGKPSSTSAQVYSGAPSFVNSGPGFPNQY